jgi:hypothetical protein
MVEKFGLNPIGINPEVTETAKMFLQQHRPLILLSVTCFRRKYKEIFLYKKNTLGFSEQSSCFDNEHPDHDPDLLRQVYTQHWDPIFSINSKIVLLIDSCLDGRQWSHPFSVGCRYQLHFVSIILSSVMSQGILETRSTSPTFGAV